MTDFIQMKARAHYIISLNGKVISTLTQHSFQNQSREMFQMWKNKHSNENTLLHTKYLHFYGDRDIAMSTVKTVADVNHPEIATEVIYTNYKPNTKTLNKQNIHNAKYVYKKYKEKICGHAK